jgi:hypothetical protein
MKFAAQGCVVQIINAGYSFAGSTMGYNDCPPLRPLVKRNELWSRTIAAIDSGQLSPALGTPVTIIASGAWFSSPAISCVGLPQPRSSNELAAVTRAGSLVLLAMMLASVLMALSVCALANDAISVGVLAI